MRRIGRLLLPAKYRNQVERLSAYIPINRQISLLRWWTFDGVIDVGSHRGNWAARVLTGISFCLRPQILLIDPLYAPDPRNLKLLKRVGDVRSERVAVGAAKGTAALSVASNDGESSSILPLASIHRAAAPTVDYQETLRVAVEPLDWTARAFPVGDRLLMKLDVQGYEDHVLEGATKILARTQVLVIEVGFEEVYEGGATLWTVRERLEAFGFHLCGLTESFSHANLGPMVQMDTVIAK